MKEVISSIEQKRNLDYKCLSQFSSEQSKVQELINGI